MPAQIGDKMLLIGSRALAIRAPYLLNKPPVDFDFVSRKEEFENWRQTNTQKYNLPKPEYSERKIILRGEPPIECELIQETYPSTQMLEKIVLEDKDTIKTEFGLVPSLDMLFTLKASHKYLKNSPYFWKTVYAYHLLKEAGAQIRPEYQEFFKQREKETYTYSHPKLNVIKDNFFKDDNILYIYDHDTIHKAVAIKENPAYTYYMKDGEEVMCDKEKFFTLPEEYRINGVFEEAAVLAIERSLVPHPGKMTPKQAWLFALSKVCTSITSGWFRGWAYENIFEVVKNYDETYYDRFLNGIESGLVIKL